MSQNRITAVALALTRRDGSTPSMRGLAAELEVTPGALYRHVTGQEHLVALMIDDVMQHVAMPSPDDEADPWERIRIHVRSLMSTLDGYPGLDSLIARHGDASAAAKLRQKWLVDELRSAGLSRANAVRSYGSLDVYWLGSRQRAELNRTTFYFGLDRLLDGLRAFADRPTAVGLLGKPSAAEDRHR